MAKKRRRRARSKKSNPTKKRHVRRRKRAASPKRSYRRTHRRVARRSPRRAHARSRKRNPGFAPKRRRSHRRSRRNPSGPYGDLAKGLLAGAASFLGAFTITHYITSDPSTGTRNRAIVGGAGLVGGALLAKKHPHAAIGVALGSLLSSFGGVAVLKLLELLPSKSAPTQAAVFADPMNAVFADPMSAVFSDPMSGYEQIGAYQQIGAYEQIGDVRPAAPWNQPTPFG